MNLVKLLDLPGKILDQSSKILDQPSKMEITRSFVSKINELLESKKPLIQVVLGPRQVGKTTGVKQVLRPLASGEYHYASADGSLLMPMMT